MQLPKDLFPNQMEAYKKLVQQIFDAFDGVTLEDGVGLWEAQGRDDRLSAQECAKLRAKDETKDWRNIKLADLLRCGSSPSFFDAKGLRFHLPYLLLYAIDYFDAEEDVLMSDAAFYKTSYAPEIEYKLTSMLNDLNKTEEHHKSMLAYHNNQFALLNVPQIRCIISFLQYRIVEVKTAQATPCSSCGIVHEPTKKDKYFNKLEEAITYWQGQIRQRILANPKLFDATARILNDAALAVYQYNSQDELWGAATLIVLPKKPKHNKYSIAEVHFALLLKTWAVAEIPHKPLNSTNAAKLFKHVMAAYFENNEFQTVATPEFLKNYQEVIAGIGSCTTANYTLNDQPVAQPFTIATKDIKAVYRDLNEWNQRAYFLTTNTHYLYFDWGTSA